MTCACLSMDTLLDYIERYHSSTPASVNASVCEDFERNFGRMPTDLEYLYSQCASLSLFNDKVVILPLSDLSWANEAVFGKNHTNQFSTTCVAFCRFDTGGYVGYELPPTGSANTSFKDLDSFFENEPTTISRCLTNFLTNLLVSEGELFWLDPGYKHH